MNKYRSRRVTVDGEKFDSKREAHRWAELRLLERAMAISDLRRQVPFELAPAVVIQERKRPPLRFVADFVYVEAEETVVEDCKGFRTPVYRLKRHLMKTVHGIEVRET